MHALHFYILRSSIKEAGFCFISTAVLIYFVDLTHPPTKPFQEMHVYVAPLSRTVRYIDPGDNARIFHIAAVRQHIPVLDSFIPKPLNPQQ